MTEVSPWRPIATAPKDGTRILVLCEFANGREPTVVRWVDSPAPAGPFGRFAWREMQDSAIAESVPKFWMPIPDAPEPPPAAGTRVREEDIKMPSATHEERLGDAPIDPKFRELMNDLAADLDTLFNPGLKDERMVGFVLLAFPLKGCEGLVNYISNTNRADVVTMLKEQLERFSKQDVDPNKSGSD